MDILSRLRLFCSMRKFAACSCIFFCLTTSPASVFAGDALKVELLPKVLRGAGYPALIVHAEEALEQVSLVLVRSSDRKKIRMQSGPIHAGRHHRFELRLKKGRATFSGSLMVELENGQSGEMPIKVDAQIVEPIKLVISPQDLDLKKRQLKLQADRDVARIQISVMSDTGTPMGTVEHSYNGQVQPAGTKFVTKWKQSKGRVMRINIKAWDSDEFYGAIELFPWKLDIPHEEINFPTGSAAIPKEEQSKLVDSLAEIKRAISKYGGLAKLRLFIAGHTDTVGDGASNRILSKNRARSIGAWFHKNAIQIPIMSAGLGEDELFVSTPDNTDEIRNRRAEYVVSVDAPPLVGGLRWQKL
jgi:outer membrane protein OmpA-like peptidoglycan-associated protein